MEKMGTETKHKGRKAVLTACSNPIFHERLPEIFRLRDRLMELGLETELAPGFFDFPDTETPSPVRKAKSLNACFADPATSYIFDVSGGDLANSLLPYLDYEVIRESSAVFYGYSDLTTIINAIVAKTGRPAVNYQIRNILYEHEETQTAYLLEKVLEDQITPDDLEVKFLRGREMHGCLLGGNMRCFLKLAGTPYWPDMQGSILLLEAMGGRVYQMMTMLDQFLQMGVFDQVSGVLLGTFSTMEKEGLQPSVEEMILERVPERTPVAKTKFVGHFSDARAAVTGKMAGFYLF